MAENRTETSLRRELKSFASDWSKKASQIRKQKDDDAYKAALDAELEERLSKIKESFATKDDLKDMGKDLRKSTQSDHLSTFEYDQIDPKDILDNKAGLVGRQSIEKMLDKPSDHFKGRETAVSELHRHNDTCIILSHLLKRRPTELEYYDTYFRKNSELAKALTNADAGSGLEWVPTVFSADFINRMEQQYEVASTFPTVSIPQGTDSMKIPGAGAGISVVTYGTATGDDLTSTNWINGATPGSRNVTLTPAKMAVRVEIEEEAIEDSIVNVIQDITIPEMQLAAAKGVDDAIINGDSDGTPQDTGVAATDPRSAWDGIRKIGMANNSDDGGGDVITIADIKANLKGFVEGQSVYYDPPNMRLLCNLSVYMDLLTISEVLTRDKIGEAQMTIDKGSLMSILGVPIIRTELMRSVSATGFIAGSGNTLNSVALYHTRAFVLGQKRDVTIKSREEIETDRRKFVLTFRTGFVNRYPATDNVAGVIYNIS